MAQSLRQPYRVDIIILILLPGIKGTKSFSQAQLYIAKDCNFQESLLYQSMIPSYDDDSSYVHLQK